MIAHTRTNTENYFVDILDTAEIRALLIWSCTYALHPHRINVEGILSYHCNEYDPTRCGLYFLHDLLCILNVQIDNEKNVLIFPLELQINDLMRLPASNITGRTTEERPAKIIYWNLNRIMILTLSLTSWSIDIGLSVPSSFVRRPAAVQALYPPSTLYRLCSHNHPQARPLHTTTSSTDTYD